jgi:hypothetical protein
MLCGRVSLLRKITRVPGAIVKDVGLAPFAVIVIVREEAVGSEGPEGIDGDSEPPQAAEAIVRRSRPRRGAIGR